MSDITRDYSFGGWLRTGRLAQELTLRAAATKLGMDAGNLSKLERSELSPPRSLKEIRRICRKLGMMNTFEILASTAFQHHLGKLRTEFAGVSEETVPLNQDGPEASALEKSK